MAGHRLPFYLLWALIFARADIWTPFFVTPRPTHGTFRWFPVTCTILLARSHRPRRNCVSMQN